jgi:small conductance mechanosensitive channel
MRFDGMILGELVELSSEQEEVINQISENPHVIREYFESMYPSLLSFLIQVVLAVVVFFVGSKIIGLILKILRRSLEKSRAEAGVVTFLSSLLKYALYFILCMMILAQFGVTTSSVVAVLGSAGLTIGLALQGSLSNFAGGVLILLLKPFVVGDYIIESDGGKEGTVSEISIFYTKLLTIDNRMVMIPNGTLSNTSITNVSRMENRRLDLTVNVSYHADLAKAKKILEQVVKDDPESILTEPLDIFVSELGESAIVLGVHVWVKNEVYWYTKWRMTEQIKLALDAGGIEIPFPQVEVTMADNNQK